jgi:transposase-like protein
MKVESTQQESSIDKNGVDLAVLEYYLAMTPSERFEVYERQIKIIFQFWRENGIHHEFECEYFPHIDKY